MTCLVYDLRQRRLPNWLILCGLIPLGLDLLQASAWSPAATDRAAAAVLAAALTLPGFLKHRLGAGDVKLMVMIGLLAGLLGMLVSFLFASVASLIYAAARRGTQPRGNLPLGGFAAAGLALYLGVAAAAAGFGGA